MPLPPDPNGGFLNDLSAIEKRIERNTSESRTAETLDWREKRYRHLVENSLGLICTHALDGTVLSVNPAAANSLGYEPRDGVGRNLRDFLAPGTRHLFDAYLQRIREQSRDSGLMRVARKDGSERLWLYRNVLYSEPGAEPYVLGHAIDVTERAAAEAAARRSQVQTLQATGRLAGSVAHAFNNLLTVIIGSTEMLMTRLQKDQIARAHLEAIMRAASRAATVTRQLLAVGGQQSVDHVVLDLNAIVRGVQPTLVRLAGPKVSVAFVPESGLPNIEGDAAQIEQILLDLASNARDAMADGGTLTIETSSAIADEIRERDHPDVGASRCVWLTLRDTGCGMDARALDHLFEPFFTTKSSGVNAGLGLPAVYGVIQQLGGSIAVDSEVGHGTTITIALPRASAVRGADAIPSTPEPRTAGQRTIVLVDDEDDVRAVMRSLLEQRGYLVLDAGSGAEAIRMLAGRTGSIDLLLTDVLMPGMSGRELYEFLSRRQPGLKVLFVSGYADDAFTREPGMDAAFLGKPFLLETLAQKVREVLDRR